MLRDCLFSTSSVAPRLFVRLASLAFVRPTSIRHPARRPHSLSSARCTCCRRHALSKGERGRSVGSSLGNERGKQVELGQAHQSRSEKVCQSQLCVMFIGVPSRHEMLAHNKRDRRAAKTLWPELVIERDPERESRHARLERLSACRLGLIVELWTYWYMLPSCTSSVASRSELCPAQRHKSASCERPA